MRFNTHPYSSMAALLLLLLAVPCMAQLTPDFYSQSCPAALSTIKKAVNKAVARERRMAASLIRLHFHDCFVQGCDASILLEDSATFVGEQSALQNINSARGFNVVEEIKSAVEGICPGVVSCADVLAVAARDASTYVGGPTWTVKLGRRDSTTASKDLAEANLPLAFNDLDALISSFSKQGLSVRDMVALSGEGSTTRRTSTRASPAAGDGNLAPLDLVTPNSFDNNYYKNLMRKKGLLHSDQALFSGGSTDGIVSGYARDGASFSTDFAAAMLRMGDIQPLTGDQGEIRRVCKAVN
ncbi:hypothetical protein HPP92_020170 [Vanilla planifolia]|uniref:Peroxidase n=1 Tax=Vanilla planifolia TaxID=51239 RepID=A0A835Q8A3_VANPL|nr:hypothetical protein HPP92_020603 [Vanilla planifolia]KAG0466006.1 hypothetical protein HPP92_020170 [Vanilla planifolia]